MEAISINEKAVERLKRKIILQENQNLKKANWNNNLKIAKAQMLARKTLKKLDELQNIDRKGTREESKRKERNILISNLKKENIEIINQLTNRERMFNGE